MCDCFAQCLPHRFTVTELGFGPADTPILLDFGKMQQFVAFLESNNLQSDACFHMPECVAVVHSVKCREHGLSTRILELVDEDGPFAVFSRGQCRELVERYNNIV